ncbi:MAG: phosphomannomutase/phosphoglucomutase [Crenarchaeota archaeon]|nr:phosphomannomutase/phosphoglucomutase [Thermoproteota archaeon]MDW8033544.1 phosphomannomutase/phosphoglucomutase [Nitrososphaerota archaeon]
MKNEVFRAYDIRGVYGKDIVEEDARLIGLAFATHLGGEGKTIAVGWDVRRSSNSLATALIEGITSAGANVLKIGLVPTPLVYFAVAHRMLDGGVVVTASHNPPEWNGFKLCRERARLCGIGSGLEKVKKIIDEKSWKTTSKGVVKNIGDEILREYEEYLLKIFGDRLSGIRILIDPGNGSCSKISTKILQKFGLVVDSINDCPDGNFPSRSPEPTEESLTVLREMVKENGYDLGVGYDGDCDRALFVDDEGNVIRGDVMLALFIKHFLKNRPGEKIVYEVSCSKLVDEVCKENGVIPIMSRVGHTFILEKMLSEKARFGGEISSHLYFGEIYGLDDAIFATLQVAELLTLTRRRLSQLVEELPKYESFKKNYDVPDEIKFQVINDLTSFFKEAGHKIITLDGVRVELEEGWFILRASNTLPQVKLTAEAKSRESLDKIVYYAEKKFKETLVKYVSKL